MKGMPVIKEVAQIRKCTSLDARRISGFLLAVAMLAWAPSVTFGAKPPASNPLQINTSTLASAAQGVSYYQALAAVNGTPPYSWSLEQGFVPGGLTLYSSGEIFGTPGEAGSFAFIVQMVDAAGNRTNRTFTMNVAAGSTTTPWATVTQCIF